MLLVVIIYTTVMLGAQTASESFDRGLEAFRWQKTAEAVSWFTRASQADPGRDEYFLYLGTSQQLMGQNERAEDAFSRGIGLNGPNREQLLLNRGNLRVMTGNFDGAGDDFSTLVQVNGRLASDAMLNRANLNLNIGALPAALEDYGSYLVMDPGSPQKETIETLMGLLSTQIAADAEAARIAAEQARMAEEARQAEEERIAREEAERAARMEELLNSLSDSGKDTRSIGAGTEDIQEDFEVSDLED